MERRPAHAQAARRRLPLCGQITGAATRCDRCGGRFDPLSRQATQNAMGPWTFLDPACPTRPGCSYETLRTLVEQAIVKRDAVIRGPSTRQFWMLATRVPGVAHLFGVCHSCQTGLPGRLLVQGVRGRVRGRARPPAPRRQAHPPAPGRGERGSARRGRFRVAVHDPRTAPAGIRPACRPRRASPGHTSEAADDRRRRLAERREAHRRLATTLMIEGALVAVAVLIVLGVTLAGGVVKP
ncbi:MAG: hypothetical protein R3B49_03745 [Phycisphaerales bacterium]